MRRRAGSGFARGGARGFGLLEVLVASGLALVALLVLSSIVGNVRRATALAETASYRAQIRAAADALLRSELTRAGPAPPGTPSELAPTPPYLSVALSAASADAVAVRYLDDAYRSAPAVHDVELTAGRDGRGRPALYLRVGAAARQPALEAVSGLAVASLLTRGASAPPTVGSHAGVVGIVLEVAYSWGEVDAVVVPLAGPLVVEVR